MAHHCNCITPQVNHLWLTLDIYSVLVCVSTVGVFTIVYDYDSFSCTAKKPMVQQESDH